MNLPEEILVAAVLAVVFAALAWALEHYWGLLGLVRSLLPTSLWRRRSRIRVSMAAILRVNVGDDYVLSRLAARPDAFGPFGGVYHSFESADDVLDRFEFRAVSTQPNPRDLRGFVPRHRLAEVVHWFQSGRDRETAEECLVRELREELVETHADALLPAVEHLRFRHIRTVYEPPRKVPGRDYEQFRCFHVYELDHASAPSRAFVQALMTEAATNPDLLIATSAEIVVGRTSRSLVAHHAEYLFSSSASRPDLPQPDFERLK